MKIKEGVILNGLQPIMRLALYEADKVWLDLDKELVVTSGLDSTHSAGSKHYSGNALDFRTRYFTKGECEIAYRELKTKLGVAFKVIWEKTHIHVEAVIC